MKYLSSVGTLKFEIVFCLGCLEEMEEVCMFKKVFAMFAIVAVVSAGFCLASWYAEAHANLSMAFVAKDNQKGATPGEIVITPRDLGSPVEIPVKQDDSEGGLVGECELTAEGCDAEGVFLQIETSGEDPESPYGSLEFVLEVQTEEGTQSYELLSSYGSQGETGFTSYTGSVEILKTLADGESAHVEVFASANPDMLEDDYSPTPFALKAIISYGGRQVT